MSLAGKVALVTGGSRGIGAATALRLARDGANVAITYSSSPDAAQNVVAEIRKLGRKAEAVQADAAKPEALAGLVAKVKAAFGRVDIVVNNAGIFELSSLAEAKLDQFDRTLNVNLRSVFVVMQEAANLIEENGRIINIGSVLGQRVPFGGQAYYATSKFALAGLSRAAARELAAKKVTVNTVQPGPIATDMNPEQGDFAGVLKAATALGRYGRAEEVAAAVAFLASSDASYITGTALNVDGGFEA